jgi:hypothetical protein
MPRKLRILLPIAAFLVAAAAFLPSAGSNPRLVQARLDAAAKVYPAVRARYDTGAGDLDAVYTWSTRWFEAERAVGGGAAAAQAHLQRMKALEAAVAARVQSGNATSADALAAGYYRAEAEVWAAQPPK